MSDKLELEFFTLKERKPNNNEWVIVRECGNLFSICEYEEKNSLGDESLTEGCCCRGPDHLEEIMWAGLSKENNDG